MIWFTIKWATISFLVVYLIHYLYSFLIDMFTVHKIIHLTPPATGHVAGAVPVPVAVPTPVVATAATETSSMHAELDAFLKQLKSSTSLDPTSSSLQHAPLPATV